MSRTQLVWILLGLIALMSGCSMGLHPFDYCGPTYTCGPGGSILSGPPPIQSPPVVVQPVGNIDFGQDILSANEGNLDGPAMDNAAGPNGPTVVEGPAIGEGETVMEGPEIMAPTAPNAAESTGWTPVRRHEASPPEAAN
jgi:hypothetical protein